MEKWKSFVVPMTQTPWARGLGALESPGKLDKAGMVPLMFSFVAGMFLQAPKEGGRCPLGSCQPAAFSEDLE